VALFVDGMVIEAANQMQMQIPGMDAPRLGRSNDVALGDLLDKYGLKIRDDLIMDAYNFQGPVPVGGQVYLANHPVFVAVNRKKSDGFPSKWVVTDRMNILIMPFPSSVE